MCTYTLQYPSNIEISNAVLTIQAPSDELEKYIMILNDSKINTDIWGRNTMCVIFRFVPFTLCPAHVQYKNQIVCLSQILELLNLIPKAKKCDRVFSMEILLDLTVCIWNIEYYLRILLEILWKYVRVYSENIIPLLKILIWTLIISIRSLESISVGMTYNEFLKK